MYGDSNCLDGSHMVANCYWLLKKMLDFTASNLKDPFLFSDSSRRISPLEVDDKQLPSRRKDVNFSAYSAVLGKELICGHDSRFEIWGTKGYGFTLMGRNRKLPGYPTVDLRMDMNTKIQKPNLEDTFSKKKSRWISSKPTDFLGLLNRNEVFFLVNYTMLLFNVVKESFCKLDTFKFLIWLNSISNFG